MSASCAARANVGFRRMGNLFSGTSSSVDSIVWTYDLSIKIPVSRALLRDGSFFEMYFEVTHIILLLHELEPSGGKTLRYLTMQHENRAATDLLGSCETRLDTKTSVQLQCL